MKKVLFVCHTNPFSATFGAEQRTSVFFKAFLENGCFIDIAYIGKDSIRDSVDSNRIRIVINGVLGYFPSVLTKIRYKFGLKALVTCDSLRKRINELVSINDYDYIACRYIEVAELAGLWIHRSKVLLDIDDLPFQSYRYSSLNSISFKEITKRIQQKQLRSLSQHWIKTAKRCFLPNRVDAEKYHVVYLPNIPFIHADKYDNCGQSLLFVGKLDWKPNFDGLLHFLDSIWPGVHEACPETHLYVAGKGLSDENIGVFSKYDSVIPLGFVPNLFDFYSRGNIVIVPVYSGSGTNIKVIEAMAMAKACIVTPYATRGYEHILKDGGNIVIANDDSEFANKLIALVLSERKAKEIAEKAFESVNSEYSQEYINYVINEQIND